jgi:hypothetical protein
MLELVDQLLIQLDNMDSFIGMESIDNTPGGRLESLLWMDIKGNLFLFGGFGYESEFLLDTLIIFGI